MQNSLLPPSYLANLGCAVGGDSGFSACEIWTDVHGLHVRWCHIGDRRWTRDALRFLGSEFFWAFAYNEEIDSINSIREFEQVYPDVNAIRQGTVEALRKLFSRALAELEIA